LRLETFDLVSEFNKCESLKSQSEKRTTLSSDKENKIEKFKSEFDAAISDDLNTPKALAVIWETLKSNIPSSDKYDLIMSFDEVLGLKLGEFKEEKITPEIKKLLEKREELRAAGDFAAADKVRDELSEMGYTVKDTHV